MIQDVSRIGRGKVLIASTHMAICIYAQLGRMSHVFMHCVTHSFSDVFQVLFVQSMDFCLSRFAIFESTAARAQVPNYHLLFRKSAKQQFA